MSVLCEFPDHIRIRDAVVKTRWRQWRAVLRRYVQGETWEAEYGTGNGDKTCCLMN